MTSTSIMQPKKQNSENEKILLEELEKVKSTMKTLSKELSYNLTKCVSS